MTTLDELKLHAEALAAATESDQKFFASIIHYTRRLRQLLTSSRNELSQAELKAITQKVERFFRQWRPTGDGLYIPPRQAADADSTVREINGITERLLALSLEEFLTLLPQQHESASQPRSNNTSPCVFIGHGRSKLWARVQLYIQDELKIPVITYESEPHTGEAIVPILEKLLDQASFAVLVLTAEDEMVEGKKRARQNVIHEAGLFQGRLGFKRAVMLVQDGIEEFSNVDGLQVIPFTKENIEQTFYELQRVLQREKQTKQ